jgi:L-threonylcarbamoyladenylate synthase
MFVDLEQAARLILNGQVVACPTETCFGLAVDPRNQQAVEILARLKSRFDGTGISLIASDELMVESLISEESFEVKEERLSLQKQFWPGALTLVVNPNQEANKTLRPEIFGPNQTLAIRVSSSIASELAKKVGGIITATSANPHGFKSAISEEEVLQYFPNLNVLSGVVPGGKASTILDVTTLPFTIIRRGVVEMSMSLKNANAL